MPEFALAKRYGVSHSLIRDARLQLTQEGRLVTTPNCGVQVGYRMDGDIQPLVVDVRSRLEQYAFDHYINRNNPDALQNLEVNLKEQGGLSERPVAKYHQD